jgi:hypothetical protein
VDEEIDAVAVLKGAITNYTVNSVSTSNNYVALMPGVNIHKGIVNGHAYLGLASGVSKGIYVLPDILATYSVPGTKFTASAGWLSTLRQNTYEQISTENPYVSNVYNIYAVSNVVQTRRDDLFIQTNGKYGDHFVYSARLGWSTFDALPGYLNDPFILRRFDVIYSRVNAITLQGGARYEVANKWSAGITVDAYKFSDHVWQQPNTKIKGDFMIMPTPKLTVTAYLTMLDGIYAQDLGGNVIKLNTIFDVGGNAEYQFTKRLSAFVQLNNLFNSKYQRWYGYEAYGLNIYGGLRLKF